MNTTPVQLIVTDLQSPMGRVIKEIAVIGMFDESNVDNEAVKIYQLIETLPEGGSLIFDLGELEFLNSKSIGYLTDWYSKTIAKNGKFVIARPRQNVYDVLNVVGLTQVIHFTMTLDEAKLEMM